MKSGYSIVWTDHALDKLAQTFEYLELNFSEAVISRVAKKIESTLHSISIFPTMYPVAFTQNEVRRAIVAKFNTVYYRVNVSKKQIEILSFFSNRQNDQNLKN